MKINKKSVDYRIDTSTRLAGGYGPNPAKQDAEALLRRAVMANLLWEKLCYVDGEDVTNHIKELIPQVAPETVARIAVEARTRQKLRRIPLFIAREMARLPEHRKLLGKLLPQIILRADEITDFLALYFRDGKQPLAKQVKIGLANSFARFNGYQLAKYNRDGQIKLRDVLFLTHPKPPQDKVELFKQLADDNLPVPDTWEVALSTGKDKKETWTRLINEGKLGALAFVRNLRNMEQVEVDREVILKGFQTINPHWLLPLNFLAAAKAAPRWERELEEMMFKCLDKFPKLPGYTVFVVDVSGSMGHRISDKSDFSRLDIASAMAMLAAEVCESVAIYATAGNDHSRKHATALVKPRRGFALADEIVKLGPELGGGGIFTRQCLEFIKGEEKTIPARIIVFSDSQDCDHTDSRIPAPFGLHNYIIDVSAEKRGINYKGIWTAEISGWSEHFLSFIAALEGVEVLQQDED